MKQPLHTTITASAAGASQPNRSRHFDDELMEGADALTSERSFTE